MSARREVDTSWRDEAACRGLDATMFFPGRGESAAPAQAVCAGCSARAECVEYALRTSQRFGVWGGTTERQRRQLRAARRSSADRGVAA